MKRLILILSLLAIMLTSFAQNEGKITGFIKDKQTQQPIEYASVALCESASHKVLTGTVTDSLGRFSIPYGKNGSYELNCKYLGYSDVRSKTFSLNKQITSINMGTILMNEDTENLNEVVVQGKRSTYIQTIDKKIFNIGTDVMAANGAVSDLLQNIPSVQVDVDGNVALRGNGNVQILIDGKPSVMMGTASRATVLSQIPASSIERVEVITNPSAQYKPDGTSGIINLIMKKQQPAGISGNVLANVGNENRYNAGFNVTYTLPKVSVTAGYNYRKDYFKRYTDDNRTVTDATTGSSNYTAQHIFGEAFPHSHIANLGLAWQPTAADRFEVSGSVNFMSFPRTQDNHLLQTSSNVTLKDYTRYLDNTETKNNNEGAFAYTHTFGKDHTLLVDFTHSTFGEIERNLYTNSYVVPVQDNSLDSTHIKQFEYLNLARAIYSRQLDEKNKIVLGYEAELDKTDMRYYACDFLSNAWVKNTDKSNDFVFNQNVHSLYGTWEHTFDRFSMMTGVRAEQSFITSHLLTLDQKVKNNYFMFYPTFHSSYKLNDNSELQFNYSLRVNRPEGDDMNPFPEYQDPFNLRAGNPYLKPEKIHSIEMGWQIKKGVTTFLVTPYYRYTFNKMTNITQILDNGVMKTTKENMSSSNAAGTELILNSAIGRWLNFNVNSNFFWNTIDASNLGYSKNKSDFSWYIAGNANFTPMKNLMFQVNTNYRSKQLTAQGTTGSTYIVNLGAKYDIPQYNLTFTATVSDLFDSFKNTNNIHTSSMDRTLVMRRQPRTFYFGVSYHFGSGSKKSSTNLKYDESIQ